MKTILLVWIGIAIAFSSTAAEQAVPQAYQAQLDEISQRVRSGDYLALFEAARLPASVAVPYITGWAWSGPGPRPASDPTARAALKEVSGYAEYLRDDIAKESAVENIPEYDFISLELIGTPEAAAVAAPYLFDFKTIVSPRGDVLGDTIFGAAVNALKDMKLADAPAYSPDSSSSAVLVAWQKWAIAKGLVPKEWSSRVAAPAWLLEMEAFEKTVPGSVTFKTLQQMQPTNSPLPVVSAPSTPGTTPSAVETKTLGHTSIILFAVIVVLLIIGGIFAWKGRS